MTVVMKLLENNTKQSYNVLMENFYTSLYCTSGLLQFGVQENTMSIHFGTSRSRSLQFIVALIARNCEDKIQRTLATN